MKWIKYQIVQSTIGEEDILVTKKLGYSEANIAIAESEAYNGEYTIEEDGETFDTKPLAIEFGGTGGKTLEEARKNLGIGDIPNDVLRQTDVVDNLESDRADLPLSARMGSELNNNKADKSELVTLSNKLVTLSNNKADKSELVTLSNKFKCLTVTIKTDVNGWYDFSSKIPSGYTLVSILITSPAGDYYCSNAVRTAFQTVYPQDFAKSKSFTVNLLVAKK